ncbi:MAG: hypothetical protein IME99_04695 [Proteobacteria bacterium]|nr:hypothetical protein [Pseudomonadota bacterium]
MTTEIKESIKVMAIFDSGGSGGSDGSGDSGVKPVRFKWRGRVYPVKEITYRWHSNLGAAPLIHFSVSDGATLFEITYNKSTLGWAIENVEA